MMTLKHLIRTTRLGTLLLILTLFAVYPLHAQVKVILDTDIGGDADDLGAVSMLHNLMDQGECEVLAFISWSIEEYAVPALDALNRYYNHPDIPIATRKSEDMGYIEWNYNHIVATNLGYKLGYHDVPDAVELYRKILQENKDSSIVIVTVGPLKNIMDLINSEPDSISPLGGRELIQSKVKEFVIMGGKFPQGEWEWNFSGHMPGVTEYVLEHLNVPITFSGYELGVTIKTGAVFNECPEDHPLYLGYFHFSNNASWMKEYFKGEILDNSSYDQTAVLYAVRKGLSTYWTKVSGGTCVADSSGGNTWIPDRDSGHSYLVLHEDKEKMAAILEALMIGDKN